MQLRDEGLPDHQGSQLFLGERVRLLAVGQFDDAHVRAPGESAQTLRCRLLSGRISVKEQDEAAEIRCQQLFLRLGE